MLKSDMSMGSVGWAPLDELDSTYELFNLLNRPNKQNMGYIPKLDPQITDLQNQYAKLLNDYMVLSDEYYHSIRDQKEALEKCIQYQNEIMELQDKYSKLQEEYIKLTHYVLDDDNNNDEINKIKIV